MPMATNTCKKHGSAYPEDECPQCVQERWQHSIRESEDFFKSYGEYNVYLRFFEDTHRVTVEDLYQHFRVRLLNELGSASR